MANQSNMKPLPKNQGCRVWDTKGFGFPGFPVAPEPFVTCDFTMGFIFQQLNVHDL
jgi:hypothetical protein